MLATRMVAAASRLMLLWSAINRSAEVMVDAPKDGRDLSAARQLQTL